jgi:predicted DCC family thiol-disulfide oxidoreductase YuxK
MPEAASSPTSGTDVPGVDPSDLLFYDGTCGLCHRWVRFVVRHDADSRRFRFAPIGGRTWRATFTDRAGQDLPDSLVLRTADGRTLVRGEAVRHIGERLGGGCATLARLAGVLPRWLLDGGYDLVARSRRHLFARPASACPTLPAELRARFEE